jgi:MFS family permease
MTNVMAGLFARKEERGKVFGILALNLSLGGLVGGSLSGAIVNQWGYTVLFNIAAPCYLIETFAALFLEDKIAVEALSETAVKGPRRKDSLGSTFYLLVLASIIASVAGFIVNLARPLLMNQLGFDPGSISGVVAVGGAVSLPFPFIMGWLSDRIGRYPLMGLCYVIGGTGIAMLVGATALWHFWLSTIVITMAAAAGALGNALVSEVVPPSGLSTALAVYGSTGWIGGVIGLAGAGYIIQWFGMSPAFVLGVLMNVVALGLLLATRRKKQVALYPAAQEALELGDA